MYVFSKKPVAWVLILVVVLLLFFVNKDSQQNDILSTTQTNKDYSKEKESLLQEFSSAYTDTAPVSINIREFSITADESSTNIIDGFETRVWTYNGTVPGPELRINFGETVRVNFTNNLLDETTIHWHGVRVTNEMDGVPGVTQEPIQPGDSFVYEFTPKDAGTFWFHPHVRGTQYTRPHSLRL